jgi:hypothetical protein
MCFALDDIELVMVNNQSLLCSITKAPFIAPACILAFWRLHCRNIADSAANQLLLTVYIFDQVVLTTNWF